MDLLDDAEIGRRLATVPTWHLEGAEIRRSVEAADFPTAIRIVDAIAERAEELGHHPDIDIRWRTLRLALSTHSAGGLTAMDFTLAEQIDAIIVSHGA